MVQHLPTYLFQTNACLFFVCFFLSRKTKRNSENKSKADISEGCNCPTNNIHSGQSLTIFQPAAFCISSFLPFLRGYDTSSLFGFSPFSLNDTKPHFLIKNLSLSLLQRDCSPDLASSASIIKWGEKKNAKAELVKSNALLGEFL